MWKFKLKPMKHSNRSAAAVRLLLPPADAYKTGLMSIIEDWSEENLSCIQTTTSEDIWAPGGVQLKPASLV